MNFSALYVRNSKRIIRIRSCSTYDHEGLQTMNCVHVPKEKLDWVAKESNHVFVLTVEMEKVLDWYRDHPHFPLDFDKVRAKVMEAHTRIEGITTVMNEILEPKSPQTVEDSATDVWL